MMSNEKKNTADFHPWDSIEGLGWSVSQQHKLAAGQMGGYFERNHLGRNRVSLAANIYRRYNRNSSSVFSGADFPLVNFFSQTSLQSHDGGRESLSQYTPLGMEPLHRMVDISPHRPHIGIKRGLMDVNMRRSAISLAVNETSSTSIYPPQPSGQSSMLASNATKLNRMHHSSSMLAHSSEQANVRRRAGSIGNKSSLDNALIAMDNNSKGGHLPGLVQRVVERPSRKGFILNPAFPSTIAKFTPLEHYSADSKTAPMAEAVSGVPAISRKAESSSEMIARQQQISSEASQSGNNPLQSFMQRAVSRQNSVLPQNNHGSHDNKVIKSEPARSAGNELWTGQISHFASPLVTVSRKFSLSSGNRFEGLGLGLKIAGGTVGKLSQQGYAEDFIPASAVTKLAPLKYYNPDSKTAPKAGYVSGVTVISRKAEPSSENIGRQEQILSGAGYSRNNRSQNSVQRAINRQNNMLSQKHYESRDNNIFKGEPARFVGNELWTGHTTHFASPLVTVNRKFSLSSGNGFEGLGLGRKIADRTVGTLSQQGYAADFIPASTVSRFAPLEHDYPDSKTAPMAAAVSGVPAISTKAESSSEIIARQQQNSPEAAQPVNNRSQSSVQRAISRQNNALTQNHYQHRDNNINKNEPARFAGNELWAGQTAHFASPLVTVSRKFSLSSGNRFEGLGLGRKIAGRTVGTSSQQGFAPDFIPGSAIARSALLEHYHPDSKTAPMADVVSGVPVINSKAEPSSEIIARREQISSEAAQLGNNRSQSSVHRAVDRQNSSLSQITPEPRIWRKVPEMISAKQEDIYQLESSPLAYSQEPQHGYPAISSNNNTNGVSGNSIHSSGISSLLMRSAIISPTRTTNRIQALLSQQQPSIPSFIRRAVARKSDYMLRDNSTRPVETADLNVLTLSSRANLFSSGEESFMPETTRALPIEQGDSFYSDRGMDSATQLPLSQPYVVQRKTALFADYAAAGDGSGYLQRQEDNKSGALTSNATLVQTAETPGSVSSKSDSNALSTDDVVDKVWRKLMRKLVLEQERMGGSSRWA